MKNQPVLPRENAEELAEALKLAFSTNEISINRHRLASIRPTNRLRIVLSWNDVGFIWDENLDDMVWLYFSEYSDGGNALLCETANSILTPAHEAEERRIKQLELDAVKAKHKNVLEVLSGKAKPPATFWGNIRDACYFITNWATK